MASIPFSGDPVIDALIAKSDWVLNDKYKLGVQYFTFEATGVVAKYGVTVMNATYQDAVRRVLAQVEKVTGIKFVEQKAPVSVENVQFSFFIAQQLEDPTNTTFEVFRNDTGILNMTGILVDDANLSNGQIPEYIVAKAIAGALGLAKPGDVPAHAFTTAQNTPVKTVMSSLGDLGLVRPNYGLQTDDLKALYYIYGADGPTGNLGYNSATGPSTQGFSEWLAQNDFKVANVVQYSHSNVTFYPGGTPWAGPDDGRKDITLTFDTAVTAGRGKISLRVTNSSHVVQTIDVTDTNMVTVAGNVVTIKHKTLADGATYTLEYGEGTFVSKNAQGGTVPVRATFKYEDNLGYVHAFKVSTQGFTLRSAAGQTAFGSEGSDIFSSDAGISSIKGLGGDDWLEGNQQGITSSVYSTAKANYTISQGMLTGRTAIFVDGSKTAEGKDILFNMKRLVFSDVRLAFDVAADQNAGKAALLVGSVLGASAVKKSPSLMGGVIKELDSGASLLDLCQIVAASPDLATYARSSTDAGIARYFLQNVLGYQPDSELVDLATNYIAANGMAQTLYFITTHPANQSHVDLVGLSTTGLVY